MTNSSTVETPLVVDFIETVCRLTKGRDAGKTVELRGWQRSLLNDLFQLRPDGLRRYRRGLIGMPRKNGKSLLGAGLALYGLLADGEMGAEVYSCAGDKEQARIVFGDAKRMVQMDPDLTERLKVYRDAMEDVQTGSIYRVLSSEAYTKEGLNPSMVIFDEVHVQPNDDLWNVMNLGSGTRLQPIVLGITTAGVKSDSSGRDSLCYRLYQYGKRIASGEIEDASFYFRWWEPSNSKCDYRDPKVWRECNPAFGDFLTEEDFHTTVRVTPENEFRIKRLNQWVTSHDAWLPHGAWGGCEKKYDWSSEEPVVLGFDGSYSGDATALVACSLKGHLEVIGLWEKPDGDDDWRVDIAAVENLIRETCKNLNVLEVAMDPYRWQRSMQALEAEGIPVIEWPTSSPARMVPACAKFFDAVIDKTLSHDGNADLARHVENCVVKTDRFGPRIVKEHKMSKRRIDLAVAAVIAHDRATYQREEETTAQFIVLE